MRLGFLGNATNYPLMVSRALQRSLVRSSDPTTPLAPPINDPAPLRQAPLQGTDRQTAVKYSTRRSGELFSPWTHPRGGCSVGRHRRARFSPSVPFDD